MENDNMVDENTEVVPAENPATEIMKLAAEGNPEMRIVQLERLAELAPRFKIAQDTIIAALTYVKDWVEFGDMMCLKSAAAERIGRMFPIRYEDGIKYVKEKFTDANGEGYRYVYTGYASMIASGQRTWAQGIYSSREAFLAKVGDNLRPTEEINENNIQRAAYHIFIGNAVKSLLGLRAMPKEDWDLIMGQKLKRDVKQTSKVPFGKGTKGGTAAGDSASQKELAEACIAIANAGYSVESDGEGGLKTIPLDPDMGDITDAVLIGKNICKVVSSFKGKDKNMVAGLLASQLKGKRLEISLKKAKELLGKIG